MRGSRGDLRGAAHVDHDDLGDDDEGDVEEAGEHGADLRVDVAEERRPRHRLRPRLARHHLEERVQRTEKGPIVLLAVRVAARRHERNHDAAAARDGAVDLVAVAVLRELYAHIGAIIGPR